MDFLNVFKHLLPTGRAWRLTVDKPLRQFFEGLAGASQESRDNFDNIFNDINPQLTRELAQWEQQFALKATNLTEQERRDRLGATWKALGGQDPRYIEDTLRAAGFDVYVHEWWEPGTEWPNIYVARNPFLYLNDGAGGNRFTMYDGGADSQDGDALSQDGGTTTPIGYPLVNKVTISLSIGDGAGDMQDGDPQAMDGGFSEEYGFKKYFMSLDPDTYPYYLYIGGATFPENASVPQSRRDEFEDLCLKICPLEQWLGILVTYS